MKILKAIFASLLMGCFVLPAPLKADETKWASADYVQARLLYAGRDVHTNEALMALEVRLADDWHAYWRMPGDAGLPPILNWEGSTNLAATEIMWPTPHRYDIMGLSSFGYKGNVLFPLKITPEEVDQKTAIDLKASIMVCNDICVPQDVSLAMEIPQDKKETQHLARLQAAQAAIPSKEELPSLKIENVVIGPEAIVVTAYSQQGFDDADLFIESGDDIYITAKPEISLRGDDERQASFRIAAPEGVENLANALMGQNVTLTLVSGRKAVEKTIQF